MRSIRADIPIGIASGFIDERLLLQSKDAGVGELIVKTAEIGEFCEAIRRLANWTVEKRQSS